MEKYSQLPERTKLREGQSACLQVICYQDLKEKLHKIVPFGLE